MSRCPECGVDFDEIPFVPCQTHKLVLLSQPPLSEEEEEDYLEQLAAEALDPNQ